MEAEKPVEESNMQEIDSDEAEEVLPEIKCLQTSTME
jgi:hypothetical protein